MNEITIVCDSSRHPGKVATVAQYYSTEPLTAVAALWRLAGGGWKTKQIRAHGRANVANPVRRPRCKLCGSRLNETHPQLGAALTSLAGQGVSRISLTNLLALESLIGRSGSHPPNATGSSGE